MDLTKRQEQVLKIIVDQYIASAHPVGSTTVAEGGLGVSSATIRNEMAVLEELGYIRHLHTSGGRVPTNAGYRYYVEHLMQPDRLPEQEARTIRDEFRGAHTDVQEWLKLAAIVMARRVHNVGLVTAPKSSDLRLRHLELISTQGNVALLIAVSHDGTVLQEMLAMAEAHSQEELSALADGLSRELHGLAAREIEIKADSLPEPARMLAASVAELLRRSQSQDAQVYHAGLSDLMQQPEFLGPHTRESMIVLNERLRQMVDFLQQGYAIEQVLSSLPVGRAVQVVIGAEAAGQHLGDYSFVVGRYGPEELTRGYVGVVGPTRMEYPRAVGLVRYMSSLMTDLMQAL